MPAPQLIPWETFIAQVQADDLDALTFLAAGEPVRTQDPVQNETYKQMGIRLYTAGLLTRFRQSVEVIGNETWYLSDGRLAPAALPYVARCAKERVILSRNPVIPTP